MVEGDKLGFFGGNKVKTGGECMIIVIDQGSGGGGRNRSRGRDDSRQGGGERVEVDGFNVPECNGGTLLHMGDGDVNVQGDSQVVGDDEVNAGEIGDGNAGGADQVKCMSFFMGVKVDMLGDVEIVEDVQEFFGACGVRRVDVYVEVTE